jgi:hypothetical protein
MIDAARKAGSHEELRGLLGMAIDMVEWRENAANGQRGDAIIRLFPVPQGIRAAWPKPEKDQPSEPVPLGGSLGCPEWLPRHDSNMRPGD